MIPTCTLALSKQMLSHSFIDLTSRNTNENEEILTLLAKNEQYFKK